MKTKAVIVSLLAVVFALGGAGCAGAPLGGGTGGRGAGGSGFHGLGGNTGLGGDGPCNPYYGYGCKTGLGGSLGAGGIGGAPDAGNGVICEQLAQKYSAVLSAAAACTPGAPGQCQVVVGNVPTNCPSSLCGQQSYVDDSYSAELEEVRQSWLDEGCGGPPSTCITVCDPPPPSVCLPTIPGAVTGTCVPYGSDAGASSAPDGGESCNQLAADYAAAVSAAVACTPGAPNQCRSNVYPLTAQTCPPATAVNDATAANAILQRWEAQCQPVLQILLIKCDDPPPAICVPSIDAGAASTLAGTCTQVVGAE